MKNRNTFRLVGIVTFVAIIGFSMGACDYEDKENEGSGNTCTLTIVNNKYPHPITEIRVGTSEDSYFLHKDNLSITNSQSFSIKIADDILIVMNPPIRVYAEGLEKTDPNTGKNYVSDNIGSLSKDKKLTVYLTTNNFGIWGLDYSY